jgi:hypothetical protein
MPQALLDESWFFRLANQFTSANSASRLNLGGVSEPVNCIEALSMVYRAMDKRRQIRPELDQAVLSQVRSQPGKARAVRTGLQPGQLHEKAGLAGGDEALVADQSSDPADQDGRATGPTARRLVFQLTEVLVTREMLDGILERISRLRLAPG